MKDNLDFMPPVAPGMLGAGLVAMANAGQFDSAFHNVPLTNYTVGGWDRDPLMELLEFYAPAVPVPDSFTYKEASHSEDFLQLSQKDVVRAMGAQFNRVTPARMTDVHEVLDEKGLTISVDKRAIEADPLAEEKATDRVRRILLRTELTAAITLLKAAANNTAKTWDVTAGKDPDTDVSAELLIAENLAGVRPNRIGYGSTAWSKRQLSIRAQNNAGGYASSAWTPAQLSDFLGVNALAFTEARFRDSASTLASFIGDQVIMFQAQSGLGLDDPSTIKRFSGNVAGTAMAVFRQEFARTVEITVAHKSKTKITSTLAVRKFTIS